MFFFFLEILVLIKLRDLKWEISYIILVDFIIIFS